MPDPPRLDESSREELGDIAPDRFRAQGHDAIEWIAGFLERCRELPVMSRSRPGDLLAALPEHGPEDPVPWEDTLAQLDQLILPGITHWNHPRFFAYFANTGSVPGILAAAIGTALNPNAMLWRTSPAATELEQRVLAWLAQWVGLPDSMFGIINDTASVSSLCALAAARQAMPEYRPEQGLRSMPKPLRIYASDQAHSSIDKAALLLGLGTDNVVKIASDSRYAMDPRYLAEAIRADRASGYLPCCVVATAGTTSSTSIDPLAPIATICSDNDIWLHVDAAYGGAAAIVPESRHLFAGWERADSIVLNPHKWLFTPMTCSVLYCSRPVALEAAFSLVPEYLRGDVGKAARTANEIEPVDFMSYGIQLGRPFRALKLWMVMRAYGRRGIEQRLRHHMQLAAEAADRIDQHPDFERLAPTPLSVVCFRLRPGAGANTGDGTTMAPIREDPYASLNEALLAAVNRSGRTFLSHTRLRGRFTLRLAIGNLRTTRDDVGQAWKCILEESRQLLAAETSSGPAG